MTRTTRCAAVAAALLVIIALPLSAQEQTAPLALEGLDPVLLVQGEETPGREDLTVTHAGYRYRFAGGTTRDTFEAQPKRYAIQNETCLVSPGARLDPSLFAVHEGRIWGFASRGCVEEFKADPAHFIEDWEHPEAQAAETRTVAVMVFEGVELLDFAGPGEVFAAADHGRAFEVITVGPSKEPVTSQGFVRIAPAYGIADAPRPDVLVIPGGNVRSLISSPETMAWIGRVAKEAEVVMSVCNGAFVLAHAGLLDGLEATTHHAALASLREEVPTATVHADRRFVDNGRIITSAGVSAGIDAALHVVDRLGGTAQARQTASYMEYRWRPAAEGETPGRVAARE